jgi:hypothetical protein
MKNLQSLRLLALFTIVAVIAGCSTDRLAAPSGPNASVALTYSYDSKLIGPSGGSLSVPGVEVRVPAGALSGSVFMTMTKLDDVTVELGPHGLQFNTPVSLRFETPAGIDVASTSVRWFDPSAQAWVVIPSVASDGARVAALQHFSKYEIEIASASN